MSGMDAEAAELAEQFRAAPEVFVTSPLYQAVSPAVVGDAAILEQLGRRRPGQVATFLLFGAVHMLLLAGAEHELRRYYPSIVGEAALDPSTAGPAFVDFCHAHADELEPVIQTRLVQSNVVKRAAGLRYALWAIGRSCSRPVHLVEVGASAGLLLNVDRYRYLIGGRAFGDKSAKVALDVEWRGAAASLPDLDDVPAIASRTGVDLNPLNVTDAADRTWLRALVWPEERVAAELLDAAIDELMRHPPRLIAGDAIDVCLRLGGELPPGEPRVVFHAATRMHIPVERRAAFDAAIDAMGEDGPLYHVWIEPPEVPHHPWAADAVQGIAMHGPGPDAPTVLVQNSGHLHWLEPIG